MAGAQAMYDAKGKLITHGLSAGTADKVSPVGIGTPQSHLHQILDVQPFDWALELDTALGTSKFRKMYIEFVPRM